MSKPRGKIRDIRPEEVGVVGPSIETRMSEGKALREKVPRGSHAKWKRTC